MNTKKILSILAIFLLIGTASAAVYIAIDPAARIYFGIDQPVDNSSIVTMVELPSGWTNSLGINPTNNTIGFQMYHRNTYSGTLNGTLAIELYCDTGFTYNSDGSILDFNSILFTTPTYDGVDIECNIPERFTVIDDNTVEVSPFDGELQFEGGEYKFNYLCLDLVDNAYGNYVVTVTVDIV